jgi:hypothetical protein
MGNSFRRREMADVGEDAGPESCVHQDAVKWNSYNRVVQCHRCGQVFVPGTPRERDLEQVLARLAMLEKRCDHFVDLWTHLGISLNRVAVFVKYPEPEEITAFPDTGPVFHGQLVAVRDGLDAWAGRIQRLEALPGVAEALAAAESE